MADLDAAVRGLPDQTAVALRGALATGGVQTFEVTDLPIPAGTDWSTTPHVIGTFTLQESDNLVIGSYLELSSAVPTNGVHVSLEVFNVTGGFLVTAVALGEGQQKAGAPLFDNAYDLAGVDGPYECEVRLVTGRAMELSPTVVRARVAFLVI